MNWEKLPVAILSASLGGIPLVLLAYDNKDVHLVGAVGLWMILSLALFLFANKVYGLNTENSIIAGSCLALFLGITMTIIIFFAIHISPLLTIAVFLCVWMTSYGVVNAYYEDWRKTKRVP